MNPLETYLKDVRDIHATGAGVRETSFYPALANLLNEIGRSKLFRPKVRCVMNLANRGAGFPDGGLFTADQFQRAGAVDPLPGQPPARGAIEAKGPSKEVEAIARSEQVERYCDAYGLVLVTNYRDFLLLRPGPNGKPQPQERYALAADERAFWTLAAHPQKADREHGERFCEYLKRVLLSNAPLSAPKDVAWFLASYARDAKVRVEQHKDLSALSAVRDALQEALGMRFTDEDGEHFFRSTLVQTIFYGVFSAWVLWHRERPGRTDTFNWREAQWSLHVPFIRALYDEIATPSKLGALGLVEVLNWTEAALSRVDRAAFFKRFQEEEAVEYFYEPFLKAFDPDLRKRLGVWYTPREIVQYQVARVDAVLREELGVEGGLANEDVIVLDPCCGTGAYLVEVLKKIAETLKGRVGDALDASDVKTAAMTRVFGFEVLPAPFVVSHLQLGLFLHGLGVPLTVKAEDEKGQKEERVGVYLTNSLTGWEPPKEPKQRVLTFMKELEEEKHAADDIKRGEKILVILGNPPYNGFAGVAIGEERDLSLAYRNTTNAPPPQGQGLNELYVRFFRMAERRIVEMNRPGKGVLSFISNYSWLDGLSFPGMRERFLDVFDLICIDNLHGDRIISEYAPDGTISQTIFAIRGKSPGIKVGTCVAVLARTGTARTAQTHVLYRDLTEGNAEDRRSALIKSLEKKRFRSQYRKLERVLQLGLPFKPCKPGNVYLTWPSLPELLPVSFPGVKTSRDEFLVDIDREALLARLDLYFDLSKTDDEVRRAIAIVMEDRDRYRAGTVRRQLLARGMLRDNVIRYCFRPFDVRWLYWEPLTKLLDERRADYFPHVLPGNLTLVAQRKPRREWSKPQVIQQLGCIDLMDRSASCFPMHLKRNNLPKSLFEANADSGRMPNLSHASGDYLGALDCREPELVFLHIVAILHSPAYGEENIGALRQDWPRIPLPDACNALEDSAALGRSVAAILDTEARVPNVTGGRSDAFFRVVGALRRVGGGQLNPGAGDLTVSAGWGHALDRGRSQPAEGRRVERPYETTELEAIGEAARARALSTEQALSLLGLTTYDVYLNDRAYWKNVPANVWEYCIGGYQVIKKWLSYRESNVLGRALRPEEAREATNIARRIAAILLLQPSLDANYQAAKASTYSWPGKQVG